MSKPAVRHQWSLEIVPSHADRVEFFEGLVHEIFITMIPGAKTGDILQCIQEIQRRGFSPVPHLAVRNFASERELEHFMEMLQVLGVRKVLIIGGGLSTPAGPYVSTMQALRSPIFERYKLQTVALAGHPEGNPSDPHARYHLLEKANFLKEREIRIEIVTQWSFSPEKVSTYIRDLHQAELEVPVLAGIAGPATLKTLIKYARICGVTAAREVIKKQGFNLGKLLTSNSPEQFVSRIEGTNRFHLYPFGGMEKCAQWLREQTAGNNLEINMTPGVIAGEATPLG